MFGHEFSWIICAGSLHTVTKTQQFSIGHAQASNVVAGTSLEDGSRTLQSGARRSLLDVSDAAGNSCSGEVSSLVRTRFFTPGNQVCRSLSKSRECCRQRALSEGPPGAEACGSVTGGRAGGWGHSAASDPEGTPGRMRGPICTPRTYVSSWWGSAWPPRSHRVRS